MTIKNEKPTATLEREKKIEIHSYNFLEGVMNLRPINSDTIFFVKQFIHFFPLGNFDT